MALRLVHSLHSTSQHKWRSTVDLALEPFTASLKLLNTPSCVTAG